MNRIESAKVAVIALDGFEEQELTSPVKALQAAGAHVTIISQRIGTIQAFHHADKTIRVTVDKNLDAVKADDFDALVLPGGALNADHGRMNPLIQKFTRSMLDAGKPVSAICHAPWILISAGVAQGRKLTSFETIQDDLKNAGADWSDQEVVVDENLVTSRKPDDLPAFNRETIQLIEKYLKGKVHPLKNSA